MTQSFEDDETDELGYYAAAVALGRQQLPATDR